MDILRFSGANAGCTDWVVVFIAWQEVVQQEQGAGQGPEETQRAVHYKETTPSPDMDSKYSFYSFSLLLFDFGPHYEQDSFVLSFA